MELTEEQKERYIRTAAIRCAVEMAVIIGMAYKDCLNQKEKPMLQLEYENGSPRIRLQKEEKLSTPERAILQEFIKRAANEGISAGLTLKEDQKEIEELLLEPWNESQYEEENPQKIGGMDVSGLEVVDRKHSIWGADLVIRKDPQRERYWASIEGYDRNGVWTSFFFSDEMAGPSYAIMEIESELDRVRELLGPWQ